MVDLARKTLFFKRISLNQKRTGLSQLGQLLALLVCKVIPDIVLLEFVARILLEFPDG